MKNEIRRELLKRLAHAPEYAAAKYIAVTLQEIPAFLAKARQNGDVIDAKIEFFFALCRE